MADDTSFNNPPSLSSLRFDEDFELVESEGKNGERTFTVFLMGTCSSSKDYKHTSYQNGEPFSGELISTLRKHHKEAAGKDRKNVTWASADGPGSGNKDRAKRYADPGNHWEWTQKAFGLGIRENLDHIMAVLEGKRKWTPADIAAKTISDSSPDKETLSKQSITRINIVGWSRGAASASKLAHRLYAHPVLRNAEVNIFAVDPVPGGGQSDMEHRTLPPNVKDYVGVYAADEYSSAFSCVMPTPLGEATRSTLLAMRGHHATLVGNAHWRNKYKGKITDYDLTSSGKIVRHFAEQFLLEHGTELSKTLNYSDEEMLALYEHIARNSEGYKHLRSEAYIIGQLQGSYRKCIDGSAWLYHVPMDQFPYLKEDLDREDGYVNRHHAALAASKEKRQSRYAHMPWHLLAHENLKEAMEMVTHGIEAQKVPAAAIAKEALQKEEQPTLEHAKAQETSEQLISMLEKIRVPDEELEVSGDISEEITDTSPSTEEVYAEVAKAIKAELHSAFTHKKSSASSKKEEVSVTAEEDEIIPSSLFDEEASRTADNNSRQQKPPSTAPSLAPILPMAELHSHLTSFLATRKSWQKHFTQRKSVKEAEALMKVITAETAPNTLTQWHLYHHFKTIAHAPYNQTFKEIIDNAVKHCEGSLSNIKKAISRTVPLCSQILNNAHEMIKEKGWWSKHVTHRGLYKKMKALTSHHQELSTEDYGSFYTELHALSGQLALTKGFEAVSAQLKAALCEADHAVITALTKSAQTSHKQMEEKPGRSKHCSVAAKIDWQLAVSERDRSLQMAGHCF